MKIKERHPNGASITIEGSPKTVTPVLTAWRQDMMHGTEPKKSKNPIGFQVEAQSDVEVGDDEDDWDA